MALNLVTLNAWGMRNLNMCACLFGELSSLTVDVTAVQETHFTCTADCRVLEDDYVVLSEYGSRSSVGISLIIWRSLNVDVNLVLAKDRGRMVVADVAVKSFEFRMTAVYALNIAAEKVSLFRRLALFLDDPKRIVLVGEWNVILDPKTESGWELEGREGVKAAWSTWWSVTSWSTSLVWITNGGRCGGGLIVPLCLFQILLGQSVRRADTDFVTSPTFHYVAWTGHRLVRIQSTVR